MAVSRMAWNAKLGIVTAKALLVGVPNDGHGMIADHAPRFIARHGPHGQLMVRRFLIGGQEGLDEIIHAGGLNQSQQGMLGAEGVP